MRRILAAIVVVGLCAIFGARASAGTVLTDNFNSENGGSGTLNYTGLANWNVTSGSVDLIGNGFFDFFPGNGLYLDMDGSTGQAGTIVSKQIFGPGTYTLSFDLAGNQRIGTNEPVTVSCGTNSWVFGGLPFTSSTPFTNVTETFTLASSSALTFSEVGGSNMGMLLDNVNLRTVPEPAFYQLGALLALGGLGALRLRKRS